MHQTSMLIFMTLVTIGAIFSAPIIFAHAALMAVIVVFLVTVIYLIMLLFYVLFMTVYTRNKRKV